MIKVNFCDFWPNFDNENLFLRFLRKSYDIEISENPDFLIYSVYGDNHLKYNDCVKILFTGENCVPDFNLCDYAMGFHYIDFGDRYLRFPLYVYYQWYHEKALQIHLTQHLNNEELKNLANRKFCNFIYSNNINSDPIRDLFYQKLSKYKRVDSGGKHLNNIGYSVFNKIYFIKDYKFTIAFENSSTPGYTTEKILEPILVNSIPIYYGNPIIQFDFNPDSFIIHKTKDLIDYTIEKVIYFDKNDDEYIKLLKMPKLSSSNTLTNWEESLKSFFDNIFSQNRIDSYRRSIYGFSSYYTDEAIFKSNLSHRKRLKNKYKACIKNIYSRIFQ